MSEMYRLMLFVLVVGIGTLVECCIIGWVYKLGRIDGWEAARSLYKDWKRSERTASKPQIRAACVVQDIVKSAMEGIEC